MRTRIAHAHTCARAHTGAQTYTQKDGKTLMTLVKGEAEKKGNMAEIATWVLNWKPSHT